jgi:hypothetical protein
MNGKGARGGGFWLLASAWRVFYAAQQTRTLARGGTGRLRR